MTTATDVDLARRLDELEGKMDQLLVMMETECRARSALGDLISEGAPVLRGAYEHLAVTLHDRDISVSELGDLLLRFAEAAPDLNRALETFQSLTSLVDDIGGLGGEAYELLARLLDELDRRGYFTFAKGGLDVVDRIVTSFDEDDIEALGDNVVLIFQTVKEMTQPDVMHMLQRSARMVRQDAELEPQKLSLFRLLREMRDPDVKLGIHRMLTMLRGMSIADAADSDEIKTGSQKEER